MRGETVRNVAMVFVLGYAGWLSGLRYRKVLSLAAREQHLLQNELQQLGSVNASVKQRQFALNNELASIQAEIVSLQGQLLERYRPEGNAADNQLQSHQNRQLWESQLSVDILRSKLPCRDHSAALPRKDARLPIYLIVVGVEGAGHHALETVWHGLEAHYDLHFVGYNPGLHTFNKDPDVSRAYQYSSIDFERHRQTLSNFLKRPWVKDKPLIIDSRNSYPEGFGVGSLAHPDLVYLSQLDGKLIDLRTLVVYRDPTACVMSAVRRFQVDEFQYKNYQFQARLVQESLNMINNAIPLLPCGKVMVLQYESFVSNPASYAQSLAELISIRKQHLVDSFGDLKPPSKKQAHPDQEVVEAQLQTFFSKHDKHWPVVTQHKELPQVDVHTGLIPTKTQENGESPEQQEVNPLVPLPARKSATGLLSISWFLHLGFNNVRFIAEQAFSMAMQLNRRLLVPSHLRMRDCSDPSRCDQAGCELRKNHYWCPIDQFLDRHALQRYGGVIPNNLQRYLKGKSIEQIQDGFARVYADDVLWLDTMPAVNTEKAFRFHLGCELAYAKVIPEKLHDPKYKSVKVFADEFASTADVLQLDGSPHKIGLTPFFWSSIENLEQSQSLWEQAVVYHQDIQVLAEAIKVLMTSAGGSYACVHLRRGDFVKAGWLGKAANLSSVAATIRNAIRPNEPIYLATDEANATTLEPLLAMGAKRWVDVNQQVLSRASEQTQNMAAFGDFVGLVEQMVCAKARVFLGSQCSSFTGQIWNLRQRLVGDTHRLTVTSKIKKPQ